MRFNSGGVTGVHSSICHHRSSRYDWRTAPTLYRWRTLRSIRRRHWPVSAVDIWCRSRTYGVPSTDRATACSTDFSAKTPAVAAVAAWRRAGVAGVAAWPSASRCVCGRPTRRSKGAERHETIVKLCTMARHAAKMTSSTDRYLGLATVAGASERKSGCRWR